LNIFNYCCPVKIRTYNLKIKKEPSAVARKNGREPEGPVGKGRDDFFLIFLFTFFIKKKSKCPSGIRTFKKLGRILNLCYNDYDY